MVNIPSDQVTSRPEGAVADTATIASVATRAGVSRQTVSNALNAPHRVRPETLARVMQVVDELGYRPNRSARSLRTQASRLIGLQTEAPDGRASSILDRFLHALTDAAREHDHNVLLFTNAHPDDPEVGYETLHRSAAVDGFVLTGTHVHDPRVEFLTGHGLPFVTFGRSWGESGSPRWVDVDGAAGTEQAVEHLASRGHRRIAFLGWSPASEVGQDRLNGWRRGVARLGLEEGEIERSPEDVVQGALAAGRLLKGSEPPTAIVCASDTLAAGALRALADSGTAAGEVGVVGFDDSPIARLVTPGLTSVAQPIEDVARAVFAVLLRAIEGDPLSEQDRVLLAPSLVVRDST